MGHDSVPRTASSGNVGVEEPHQQPQPQQQPHLLLHHPQGFRTFAIGVNEEGTNARSRSDEEVDDAKLAGEHQAQHTHRSNGARDLRKHRTDLRSDDGDNASGQGILLHVNIGNNRSTTAPSPGLCFAPKQVNYSAPATSSSSSPAYSSSSTLTSSSSATTLLSSFASLTITSAPTERLPSNNYTQATTIQQQQFLQVPRQQLHRAQSLESFTRPSTSTSSHSPLQQQSTFARPTIPQSTTTSLSPRMVPSNSPQASPIRHRKSKSATIPTTSSSPSSQSSSASTFPPSNAATSSSPRENEISLAELRKPLKKIFKRSQSDRVITKLRKERRYSVDLRWFGGREIVNNHGNVDATAATLFEIVKKLEGDDNLILYRRPNFNYVDLPVEH